MPETTSRPGVPSPLRRTASILWRTAGAALVAWVVITGWPQLRASAATLRDADPTLLVIAAMAQISALVLLSRCYGFVLRAVGGRLAFWSMAGLTVRASTVSRMLPGGGAAAALFAMRRMRARGVADGPSCAAVLLNAVVTMGALVVVTAVAGGATSAAAVGWLSGFAVLATVLVVAGRRRGLRRRLDAVVAPLRTRRCLAAAAPLADVLLRSRVSGRHLLAGAACACVAWACEMGALWLAVAAVGVPLPLSAVAVGLGAANAATAIPHTPGGLGIVEVAMTAVLVASGLRPDAALAAVLAYRIIGFWLPVAAGGTLLVADAATPVSLRRRMGLQPG